MIEDLLRCQSFVRVDFSCVASSECSSTRFFQITDTVPFLMCSTVKIVFSKTTWYWGETFPVLVFNNRVNDPACNG